MEYDKNFPRSFMERTLSLATEYHGDLDATLLINCLLGLLIVPKESLIKKIPEVDFAYLSDWGIRPGSIKSFRGGSDAHAGQPNLRQLIHRLRNSVAHFRIEPVHGDNEVAGFQFRDINGFHAELSLGELREFVIRLSTHLKENT